MDNSEILETVRENRRGNQEWTIQRYWQHLEKTDGAIKNGQYRDTGNSQRKPTGQLRMDNPETLATVRENRRDNQERTFQRYWQQLEKTNGAIKNGQSRDIGNSQRKPTGQSRMDNPEKLATVRENRRAKKSATVRENRRGNKEWTIQIHCKHLVRKTQVEDKQYIYIYIYKKNRHTQKKRIKKITTQQRKLKRMSNTSSIKNRR